MKLLEGLNKKDALLTRESDNSIRACLSISGDIIISRASEDGDIKLESIDSELLSANDWKIFRTEKEYMKTKRMLLKLGCILESVNGIDSPYCPNVIREACYNTFGNMSEKGYTPDDCYISSIITPSDVISMEIIDQYTTTEVMELASIFYENKEEIEEVAIKCLKNNICCLYDITNNLEEEIPF